MDRIYGLVKIYVVYNFICYKIGLYAIDKVNYEVYVSKHELFYNLRFTQLLKNGLEK